jgi:hypothetical protein
MSYIEEVKGAAIEASASERLIPTSAAFRAPQSLAPSPHIPIYYCKTVCKESTNYSLSIGDILAKT